MFVVFPKLRFNHMLQSQVKQVSRPDCLYLPYVGNEGNGKKRDKSKGKCHNNSVVDSSFLLFLRQMLRDDSQYKRIVSRKQALQSN
ncbi:Uncharacterised protein [Mycobacteroides abscessus subsp. abscessus]|nr:Uncharacterised protein [Mycobacteroides abscessus subsp. abscessus]